jgi:hypothetical protein
MELPPVLDAAVFMALVLVLSLFGLAVSGHFPEEFRAESLRTSLGRGILWATLAVSVGVGAVALAFAWWRLPLYVAVIGGGAMLLIAPILLRPFPDSFVNGRAALLAFTLLGVILAMLAGHRLV